MIFTQVIMTHRCGDVGEIPRGISSTIGPVTTTAATARKSGADADTNTKQIIRQIRFTNPEEIGHFY